MEMDPVWPRNSVLPSGGLLMKARVPTRPEPPERARELLRDDARHGVDAAAGRVRHDKGDGAGGIILREGETANDHRDRGDGRGPRQPAHRSLPYFWPNRPPPSMRGERRPSRNSVTL